MICCFIFSSAFIIVSFYVSSMPLCFSFIGLSCFPHWEELRKDSTHSSAGRHSHSHRRISQNRVRLSQPQRTALSESLLPSLMDRDRHSWILLPSGWLNTWEWVVYRGCVALWLVQYVWVRYGFCGIFLLLLLSSFPLLLLLFLLLLLLLSYVIEFWRSWLSLCVTNSCS